MANPPDLSSLKLIAVRSFAGGFWVLRLLRVALGLWDALRCELRGLMRPLAKKEPISARIAGLAWRRSEFCAGWLITGACGTGKTRFLEYLLHQLFQHETGQRPKGSLPAAAPFGGLVLEEEETSESALVLMARHYGRQADLKILATRPVGTREGWIPPVTFNLLSEDRVPARIFAEEIARAAQERDHPMGDSWPLHALATLHLTRAIELQRALRKSQVAINEPPDRWVVPALDLICKILTSDLAWKKWLVSIGLLKEGEQRGCEGWPPPRQAGIGDSYCYERFDSPDLRAALEHFRDTYWASAGTDKFAEVQRVLRSYLGGFLHPEIGEVFCRGNSFEWAEIDRGALILLAMPRPFRDERRCISALLRQIWFAHILRRFDFRRAHAHLPLNLAVLFQDDAPPFIPNAEQAVEIMRLAEAATVMTCRSRSAAGEGVRGTDGFGATRIPFLNRFILRAADVACAAESAQYGGKRVRTRIVLRRAFPYFRYESNFGIEPEQFWELGPLRGVLVQRSGRWKSICFQPLTARGRGDGRLAPLEPWALKLKRWLGRNASACRAPLPHKFSRLG